ncbi:ATP-dependent helicase HrpB [Methylopila sp. M107]|uniref:ATP-dependent helicase HrpB n=1 Tax=Methylopila sp. M107 TaxID=1101190 RepID=UPI000368BE70|nr:ATP-dependent helicase HrpB [Methylopila sp. M107]
MSALPVEEALPRLMAALDRANAAVLVAPPGAGKTTRVPLALLDAGWRGDGKILVLEPRRLAARAAAARMAATLGQSVGETVGLRVRLGSKVSKRTRIEVVTDGVFARMIVDDPELEGVAAVLFDEFHERSLDADLGLALARDAQAGLREDLRILVMSATLDGARVAKLLGDAEVVTSEGRAFPVQTRHLSRDPRARIEDAVALAARKALAEETGSLLVFLPGRAEIRRTAERLVGLPESVDVVELHGGLDPRAQDLAVAPAHAGRRKVVLATSIAETSLTIEGVRVVIDSGLARAPRHEPALGITRLETVRASQASVDQRRGRAGRTEPGVCYRLWEEAATRSLPAFAPAEILASDLSGLLLDLAAWGVADPASLAFLDPPPAPAVAEARTMLTTLLALDGDGRLTERGAKIRSIALPPRLAAMLLDAVPSGDGPLAAQIALLSVERGLGGDGTDLGRRLERLSRERGPRAEDARRLAANWLSSAGGRPGEPDLTRAGLVAARAFPDRIAKARGGRPGAFLLANGRGAALDETDPLAREAFLAVLDLTGVAERGRILLAAALDEADLEEAAGDRIETRTEIAFDPASGAVRGRARRKLGAITLAERPVAVAPGPETARALAVGLAASGIERLPWSAGALALRARAGFLAAAADPGADWPDLTDAGLGASAEAWLAPFLEAATSLRDIGPDTLSNALDALFPYPLRRRLDAEAPSHFEAPTGSRLAIDYAGEDAPAIELRVQELYGLSSHPTIANGRLPLTLRLLSPAHRPIQVTRDLPGFWRGSWKEVRTEMRGRYPRHLWPEDPAAAAPTTRAKPRGT